MPGAGPPAKSQADILREAISAAQEAQAAVPNYPPALLPVQVAQFVLESDWGTRHLGSANNYFGIKARDDEPFVTRPTREWIGGRMVTVMAKFRAFDSMAACFAAHADLICNRRFRQSGIPIYAKALQFKTDPLLFAHALTGTYATDPEYGNKLERIMRAHNLLELAAPPNEDFSDVE